MNRKVSTVCCLVALILAACGRGTATPQPALPSVTPKPATATATASNTPVVTETPPAPETPEVPSDTPYPTNAADCTNSAAFVLDVTIPDNTVLGPGETFTKIWRVENTGTCTWNPEYTLDFYSENAMGFLAPVPLSVVRPGETTDLSLVLVAPDTQGIYRGNFVIKNGEGLIMQVDNDSRLWLIINVNSTAPPSSPTPTATATATQEAACVYTTDPILTEDVLNAVNDYRAQNGLAIYTADVQLQQAAQQHAIDMACNQIYTHTGSDGSTPETRVAAAGYTASSVGENIYGSNPPLSAQDVVAWWANDQTDPRHNENLLNATHTQVGIGYALSNGYGFYVIVFATP